MAARVWRKRLSRVASIWIVVALAEYLIWRVFLGSVFYRDLVMPIALAIVIIGLAATWRTMRRRDQDRRGGDRRREGRRRESVGTR